MTFFTWRGEDQACFHKLNSLKERKYHYKFIITLLRLTSHLRSTVVLLDTRTPGTSGEIFSEDADGETQTRNPSVMIRVLWTLSLQAQNLLLGRSSVYPVDVLHHYIFIITQLWLTSHARYTVVLLHTGTPGTTEEIF